jgi:FAD/FMN-containing dehydrogenase
LRLSGAFIVSRQGQEANVNTDALAHDIGRFVGRRHVLTRPTNLAAFADEPTGRFWAAPDMVIMPANLDELAIALQLLDRADIDYAVTPRGGGTSLCGGSVPATDIEGDTLRVTIATGRMNWVRLAGDHVVAGAGAILSDIDQAAASIGLAFGVSIGAQTAAQVGASLAIGTTGGDKAFLNGTMASQLAPNSLVGVTADGSVYRSDGDLPTTLEGYTLERLFVGTEGTLGFVAEAGIELWPRVTRRSVSLLDVEAGGMNMSAVARAVEVAKRLMGDSQVHAIEWLDGESLAFVCREGDLRMPRTNPPVKLLVETASNANPADYLTGLIGDLIADGWISDATAPTTTEADWTNMWAYRKWYPHACNHHAPVVKADVWLPFNRYGEAVGQFRILVNEICPGAIVVMFGHLAGGNVHINILNTGELAHTVEEAVLRFVHDAGGQIAQEHGFGQAKAQLRWELMTAEERRKELSVKMILDPGWALGRGIRMPHKLT